MQFARPAAAAPQFQTYSGDRPNLTRDAPEFGPHRARHLDQIPRFDVHRHRRSSPRKCTSSRTNSRVHRRFPIGGSAFPFELCLTILRQLRFAVVINYLRDLPRMGRSRLPVIDRNLSSHLLAEVAFRRQRTGRGCPVRRRGRQLISMGRRISKAQSLAPLSLAPLAEGSSFCVRTDFCAGVGPAAIDGRRRALSFARTPRFSGLIPQDIPPDRRTTSCCIFGVGADPRAKLERHPVEAGRTRQHK
jgi:hypothetical protein